MKIEITRKIEKKEIVDIELPYYYEYELCLDEVDVVIYGKFQVGSTSVPMIEKLKNTSIKTSYHNYDNSRTFELEINESSLAESLSYYIANEYKSTEAKYLAAKKRFLEALTNA